MVSAHDVAAKILRDRGPMSAMKLQKLVYYCQAWHLAWDGVPLFHEEIQAWANGPVIYPLYDYHRGQFMVSEWPRGNPERLSQTEVETVDAVLEFYGDRDPAWLSELTHKERPWLEARGDLPPGARSNAVIKLEEMQDYYGGLVD